MNHFFITKARFELFEGGLHLGIVYLRVLNRRTKVCLEELLCFSLGVLNKSLLLMWAKVLNCLLLSLSSILKSFFKTAVLLGCCSLLVVINRFVYCIKLHKKTPSFLRTAISYVCKLRLNCKLFSLLILKSFIRTISYIVQQSIDLAIFFFWDKFDFSLIVRSLFATGFLILCIEAYLFRFQLLACQKSLKSSIFFCYRLDELLDLGYLVS